MTLGEKFATRLNSFGARADAFWGDASIKPSPIQKAERAATVEGLTDVDLNYPDHVGDDARGMGSRIRDLGLTVNGLAMRYYSDPAFALGAFTNPDAAVRRKAIDLTKRGIDATLEAGADNLPIWPGQDGYDTAFQADYDALWGYEIEALREVCGHDASCLVAIEYKPDEPRARSLLPDAATTLLAVREVGAPNLGITLDFAHSLYADEQPAFAAALIARHSRLLGVHLNDGNAKRDDGLMVASVHVQATLELLRQLRRDGFGAALYFDTFPDATGLDPVAECEANIATVRSLLAVADRLDADNRLGDATARQDAVAAHRIVMDAMTGA